MVRARKKTAVKDEFPTGHDEQKWNFLSELPFPGIN